MAAEAVGVRAALGAEAPVVEAVVATEAVNF
jgi:hypothetical protein